jgi:hypothetical protein
VGTPRGVGLVTAMELREILEGCASRVAASANLYALSLCSISWETSGFYQCRRFRGAYP